jgi:hypothetical protein
MTSFKFFFFPVIFYGFVVCRGIICVFYYVVEDFGLFLKGKYVEFFVSISV